MNGGFAPFALRTPVFIGILREMMKDEGFLRDSFLEKLLPQKCLLMAQMCPAQGTFVPFKKQFCRKRKEILFLCAC